MVGVLQSLDALRRLNRHHKNRSTCSQYIMAAAPVNQTLSEIGVVAKESIGFIHGALDLCQQQEARSQ